MKRKQQRFRKESSATKNVKNDRCPVRRQEEANPYFYRKDSIRIDTIEIILLRVVKLNFH
jgi:hypothetical protein